MLCFITLVEEGNDVDVMCTDDAKMKMLYQTVRRKGLLSESNKITIVGKEVLSFLNEKIEEPKIPKKKKTDSDFDKWWMTYPGTDTFTYKSQSFTGRRKRIQLRQKSIDLHLCRTVSPISTRGHLNHSLS